MSVELNNEPDGNEDDAKWIEEKFATLESLLSSITQQVEKLSSSSTQQPANLSALETKLEALQTKLDTMQPDSTTPATLETMKAQLEALQAKIDSLTPQSPPNVQKDGTQDAPPEPAKRMLRKL